MAKSEQYGNLKALGEFFERENEKKRKAEMNLPEGISWRSQQSPEKLLHCCLKSASSRKGIFLLHSCVCTAERISQEHGETLATEEVPMYWAAESRSFSLDRSRLRKTGCNPWTVCTVLVHRSRSVQSVGLFASAVGNHCLNLQTTQL